MGLGAWRGRGGRVRVKTSVVGGVRVSISVSFSVNFNASVKVIVDVSALLSVLVLVLVSVLVPLLASTSVHCDCGSASGSRVGLGSSQACEMGMTTPTERWCPRVRRARWG